MHGLPYDDYPRGWFRLVWSDEVPPGTVATRHYFGREIVVYRTASGRLCAVDAYCQHMGAHLGVGGRVCDEDLVCPFHGWRWGTDGSNTLIPYDERTFAKRSLVVWPVEEVGGIAFVWYGGREGQLPQWVPPQIAELDDSSYHELAEDTRTVWPRRRVQPENPIENTADPAHIKYVHGAGTVPDVSAFEARGPEFSSTLSYTFGEGRTRTWLTPNGPVPGTLAAHAYGLGLGVTRYRGIHPTVQIFGVTPVDEEVGDVWNVVLPARRDEETGLGEFSARVVQHFTSQFEVDFPIWEHMRYLTHPAYPKIEAQIYSAVRRWSRQFYRAEQADA